MVRRRTPSRRSPSASRRGQVPALAAAPARRTGKQEYTSVISTSCRAVAPGGRPRPGPRRPWPATGGRAGVVKARWRDWRPTPPTERPTGPSIRAKRRAASAEHKSRAPRLGRPSTGSYAICCTGRPSVDCRVRAWRCRRPIAALGKAALGFFWATMIEASPQFAQGRDMLRRRLSLDLGQCVVDDGVLLHWRHHDAGGQLAFFEEVGLSCLSAIRVGRRSELSRWRRACGPRLVLLRRRPAPRRFRRL